MMPTVASELAQLGWGWLAKLPQLLPSATPPLIGLSHPDQVVRPAGQPPPAGPAPDFPLP